MAELSRSVEEAIRMGVLGVLFGLIFGAGISDRVYRIVHHASERSTTSDS